MDITARLAHLDEMVREAKAMPLSSSVLVNRDEVLDLIAEMQEALPDEIKQARWIVKDREELLAKARQEANSIVEQARQEQLKMARQEEIADRATREAERVLELADEEGRRIRLEAEDYVDAKLAQFENVLMRVSEEVGSTSQAIDRTVEQVRAGRDKLSGAPTTTAQQEFGSNEDQLAALTPELPGEEA